MLAGVISSDNEDETEGFTEATDGEVPGRGRAGLRGSSQVGLCLSLVPSFT